MQLEASEAKAAEWEASIQQERFDAEDAGRHAAAALSVQMAVIQAAVAEVQHVLEESKTLRLARAREADASGPGERLSSHPADRAAAEAE